jgi:hypothetical protein
MRSPRRFLATILATSLVVHSAIALTLASCRAATPEDELATAGAACPMHHGSGEECTCPEASSEEGDVPRAAGMPEHTGEADCRLQCGASHEIAALFQGPSGVMPPPVAEIPPNDLVALVRIGDRTARALLSPPLSPPPRV